MPQNILLIIGGLVGLWIGAELLVRGASTIAQRLGMSPLVTGLTVVSMATSMPEFIVSLQAALQGYGNIAAGNVIGSNIANVAFILGVAALIRPINVKFDLVRFDTPLMVAICFGFAYVFQDYAISREEGLIMLALLVVYLTASVIYARKTAGPEVRREFEEAVPRPKFNSSLNILLVLGGVVLLAIGGRLLVDGASSIARAMSISDAVIALTIVALGTSTPELAASLVAVFRGAPDLAAGNIVGSNIFNILGIVGACGAIAPLSAPGISMFDVYAMCGVAALLIPLLMTGYRIARIEGAILLAVYGGYVSYLWPKV